jgi:hypothetical protein
MPIVSMHNFPFTDSATTTNKLSYPFLLSHGFYRLLTMARVSYVNSTTITNRTPKKMEHSPAMKTSHARTLKANAHQYVKLERAIRHCQRITSSASTLPSTPCLLDKTFEIASNRSTDCGILQHREKPSRRCSLTLPQLQEAISISFCRRGRNVKKARRNAFVIHPNVVFPYGFSAPRAREVFLASSPEVCSSSFPLSSEQHQNDSGEDISLVHINESMHVLKGDFSELRLGDAK